MMDLLLEIAVIDWFNSNLIQKYSTCISMNDKYFDVF